MEPGKYLNDSFIDLKVKYLINSLNLDKKSKVFAFSCLFYAKLTEVEDVKAGYGLVSRWTKHVNIFDCDFVFFPINLENHWSLFVAVRPGLMMVNYYLFILILIKTIIIYLHLL